MEIQSVRIVKNALENFQGGHIDVLPFEAAGRSQVQQRNVRGFLSVITLRRKRCGDKRNKGNEGCYYSTLPPVLPASLRTNRSFT